MPSQEYQDLLDRAWDLHVAKNAGYAGADNPDPWANFRMCEAFGISAFTGAWSGCRTSTSGSRT